MNARKSSIVILLVVLHCLTTSCSDKEVKQQFYENGNIEIEYEYQISTGLKDGFYRVYLENGKLKYEGNYADGLKTGWHILYYDNGTPNQKSLWAKRFEKELATRKLKYDEYGHLVSDFTFADKKISVQIVNRQACHIGDTIAIKLTLKNSEHPYCESTIGKFDENLNVLAYLDQAPVFQRGNAHHEIRCLVQFARAGVDTLKWLVRDFDIRINSDSTKTTYGTESYLEYPLTILER